MDRWEVVLLIVGAFVAVRSLVRLMRARRDLLVAQVQAQIEQNKKKQQAKRARADESAA